MLPDDKAGRTINIMPRADAWYYASFIILRKQWHSIVLTYIYASFDDSDCCENYDALFTLIINNSVIDFAAITLISSLRKLEYISFISICWLSGRNYDCDKYFNNVAMSWNDENYGR